MFYGILNEAAITKIPNEVKDFVNSLNNNIKKIKETDLRNTRFEAAIDKQERTNAQISNNLNLSREGIVIKITLPVSPVSYEKFNVLDYIYKFLQTEFNKSKIKKDYNYHKLNPFARNTMYACLNIRKDSDALIDQMKATLKKDKYYDDYEEPIDYLNDKNIKKAIEVKEFFDAFIKKYKDKAFVFYTWYHISIEMSSKYHSSNPFMKKYISLNNEHEKGFEDIFKKMDAGEDVSEEAEKFDNDFSEAKDKMAKEYIRSTIMPALEYAKKETNSTKKISEKNIFYGVGGGSQGPHAQFSIRI